PRHWAPYEGWLKLHQRREPGWRERWTDLFIHSELLLIKLPLLFLTPQLRRRSTWPDEGETAASEPLTAVAAG
ncbi:MAG TPA: ferritin-like domain-containing protein, partial [Sphingomicrobium sp.]|nr:ferritin-like domain-containing protein [Sphingomicrobium sp.]